MGASSSVSRNYAVPPASSVALLQDVTDELWGEQQIRGGGLPRARVLAFAATRGVDDAYVSTLELPESIGEELLGSWRAALLAAACEADLEAGGLEAVSTRSAIRGHPFEGCGQSHL